MNYAPGLMNMETRELRLHTGVTAKAQKATFPELSNLDNFARVAIKSGHTGELDIEWGCLSSN